MLSRREQQIWAEIEHSYGVETEEATRVHLDEDAQRDRVDQIEAEPAAVIAGCCAVVVGVWLTAILVVLGALLAGAAVGSATALLLLRVRARSLEPVVRHGADP